MIPPRRNTAAARLAALLDALETDLRGASPDEIQAAVRETGRARETAVREIRSLLRDAEAQGHGVYPLGPSDDERDGISILRH